MPELLGGLFSATALVVPECTSSNPLVCLLLPHILQHTSAIPPSNIAPPIPPTTPPMTFFDEVERPPDPPLLDPACRVGVVTMVS